MIKQGLTFGYKGTTAKVVRHIPTAYSGGLSTFVEVDVNGESQIIHQNTIKAILDGSYVEEKTKRKIRTKKERAADHVAKMIKQGMSRGEIIKELAKKLRVSKASAQTYYYAVK